MYRRLTLLACTTLVVAAPIAANADSRTDARRYFTRGMAAIRSGAYTEGAELLLRAYDIKPHPNVLYNVARAFASGGEIDRALEYFNLYLESNPGDADRVSRAVEKLESRRRLRGLVDEGMTAIAEGRHSEGIALLQKAYNERPHANLLFNIARAQEETGDLQGAISNFSAYLGSRPPDAPTVKKRVAKLRERLATAERSLAGKEPKKPDLVPIRPRDPGESIDARQLAEMVVDMLRASGQTTTGAPTRIETKQPILTDSSTATGVALEAKEGGEYEEVVVTASRRAESPLEAPNAITIITEEDIRLSGARSIPDLLRRVPGMDVMAMSYADWNVALRGFNRRIANKLLILVDGRTAYQDFLGGMLWLGQSYDLMDIARIEVVRGPGSAIYGANAYSGIVNIITKRPEEINGSTVFMGGGNGGALRGAYQYGKRNGPIGVRASVGYEQGNKYDFEFDPKRVDYTAAAPESTRGNIDRSIQVVRADAYADYDFGGDKGRLYAGAGVMSGYAEFYGVSALRNQNNDGTETNVRLGYDSGVFSVLGFWNALNTRTKPQFFKSGTPDLGSEVDADLVVVEPVFRPTFSLLGQHQLVLGAEYRHKRIEWNYIDDKHSENHFAVFLQDSWAITDLLTLILSYRIDSHPLIGLVKQPDLGIPGSPRLAVIVKPAEGQAIRATVGTAFRQPTQAETYLDLAAASPVRGVAIKLVGEQDLLPEDIITIDVGYLNQSEFAEWEIVGYFNRVNNLITRAPLAPTAPDTALDPVLGAFVGAESLYFNEDRVFFAAGGELSARVFPIDGLDVGASYAFQYIFDKDSGDRFTDSPVHKATLWGQFRSSFGFDLGATVHFVSSQDWIEPEFDTADPSGFRLDPSHIESYFLVMARVGYRMFDDQIELALSGTNLLDTGNNRHIEHPFANRVAARVLGSVTARF